MRDPHSPPPGRGRGPYRPRGRRFPPVPRGARRHTLLRAQLGAVTALLAVLLAACGSGSPSGSASSGGGSATKLTVPAGSVSAAQGAFQYTVSQGFFRKNGLSVTTPLSAEGQLKASFVAGSVDFDQLAGGDVLDLYAKHVGVKVIGCTATTTGYYLYAKKGTASVAALAGKNVGVPSLGGAPQVAMEAYLVSKGLKADAVKFVPLGSIPNVLTALTSGKIDSGLLSTPFNFRADKADLADLGYATGPPTPYLVNSKWAKQHPDSVTAILKSLADGAWSYQTHKDDAVTSLGKFLGLDPSKPADKATLSKSFDAYLPPVQAPVGRCSADYFTPYVKYQPASQRQSLKNLTPLIDNSYVDSLDKQGFYQKLQQTYGPLPKGTTLAQVLR
ncbi:ABC-type nitrate/sulfonate/bicarbonate transport system, substrate-binding protein [Actinacidiphila yanglinensis]|uniref:ABC-type nitrate/sulfonate/bicarbonate transport system, substrate-binding protein n=1 Tax=Actinacidiphila yanglinensis TaxID=310779 RepID=A0A1H6B9V1_9ACTN|nr:ABC transporter substrate-binding protein [Actinacidiphila yanglinensis]SEG57579.1 ABC-type nitrate/sulfonate/bicarbonate transport system, substrate-binding protein [Actinacidiphila yanglinensis]